MGHSLKEFQAQVDACLEPDRRDANLGEPSLKRPGNKLRAVVKANELRLSVSKKERIKSLKHFCIAYSEFHCDTFTVTHKASRVYSSRTVSIL